MRSPGPTPRALLKPAVVEPSRPSDAVVLADVAEGRYTTAWLVPSEEFASRAKVRADGKRRFVASLKPNTKDQWVSFRHRAATLPAEVLRILSS